MTLSANRSPNYHKHNGNASTGVVGVVATFRRPAELERLIRSLSSSTSQVLALIVTDNARDIQGRPSIEDVPFPVHYVTPDDNLGCGGGLKAAMEFGFSKFDKSITHFWILDDDAIVTEQALRHLLDASNADSSSVLYPTIVDGDGKIGWFPGLSQEMPWREIRRSSTQLEYLDKCGTGTVPFSWCPGVALLISADAIREKGFHRTDFWIRGEDLEFSLRLTDSFKSSFVPEALVYHVMPMNTSPDLKKSKAAELLKRLAMIQNLAYLAFRLPHGRPVRRTIPGNCYRLLKDDPEAIFDVVAALWLGAVMGHPAGTPGANIFQTRALSRA